jgi:hypothetical protein
MEPYDRPEILATYDVAELAEEATVCMTSGPYPVPAKHDK